MAPDVAGVLIGGGVTAVSPAGAEVSQAAATNWKKIWKKKLQPLADKRYYTKSASDVKYSTKAETGAAFANYYTKAQSDAALSGYYTKAQADAKYQPVGNYAAAGSSYTKAEGDAKYSSKPVVLRGAFVARGNSPVANGQAGADISFGVMLAAAPTVHYILDGGVPPANCSGTTEAPAAAPGHLCLFEGAALNILFDSAFTVSVDDFGSSRFGTYVGFNVPAATAYRVAGSWALGVSTFTTAASVAHSLAGDSGGAPADLR